MTFLLTYFSALDCAIRRKGAEMEPLSTLLCADSTFTPDQVAQAFLRHHPGSEVLACIQQP